MENKTTTQIIFTNKAKCHDCYRCVRNCPVKAIRMENNQANVDESRCILCGKCIRECPQNAKAYRDDTETVKMMLREKKYVALSLAPSFPAAFSETERKRLPSALRRAGFKFVGLTAEGAYHSAMATIKHINSKKEKSHICTACPVVVSYVEKYKPNAIENLVPVSSPMMIHSRLLREKLPKDSALVFAGPCIAKKAEAERPENNDGPDTVITFDELKKLLSDFNITINNLEESDFDNANIGDAAYFPVMGGLLKTAGINDSDFEGKYFSISGYEQIKEFIEFLPGEPMVVEPLFCEMGCINGPGLTTERNLFERKRDVLKYAKEAYKPEITTNPAFYEPVYLFTEKTFSQKIPSESEIKSVLESTGKFSTEDELNCGACGYPSCREKAIAVINGMAQKEMCLPYMRRLAESKTDKVIDTSPNGIVILNEAMEFIYINPTFKNLFKCSSAVIGKKISTIMSPEYFEELAASDKDLLENEVSYRRYGIICHQKLYKLTEEKQYVGIFVDVTKNVLDVKKLNALRTKTIQQAQSLLEHQVTMAQELAKFLGENTAKGEELVENLMKLTDDEEKRTGERGKWLRDLYTSK